MDKETKRKQKVEQAIKEKKIIDDSSFATFQMIEDLNERLDNELPKVENILTELLPRIKGDKGDAPTERELLDLITPLIPEIPETVKGDDGKDYILTEDDKKEIANSIKVPIVEKETVIEKTEVVRIEPIVTENVVEKAVTDEPIVIANKLNTLKEVIEPEVIKGFKDLQRITKENSAHQLYTGVSETRVKELIKSTPGTGGVISIVAGTNIAVDSTDPANPIVTNTQDITGLVPNSRTISTTAPLAGGGDLSVNRTLTTSMSTNKLIGRGTVGTGVMEEITLGTNLSLSGTTLNATGQGSGTWGSITGTLSTQTDLQNALDLKAPLTTPTFLTNITTPLILGGTSTTSSLTLQTTSGVGTTGSNMIFKVGNNGVVEAMRYTNVGNVKQLGRWTYPLTRTIPTTVGDAVDIGSFSSATGELGSVFYLSVAVNLGGYAQAKLYYVSTAYNITAGLWNQVIPISDTGPFSGNDLQIDANVGSSSISFRARRSASTVAGGTINIMLVQEGDTADTFTPSTSVTSPGAVSLIYPLNQIYQASTNVGISAINPPTGKFQVGNYAPYGLGGSYLLDNWNSTGAKIPAFFVTPNNNGGNSLATAEPALVLSRLGVGGESYSNFAEFKMSHFAVSGTKAKTQLDIALTDGDGDAAGTNIISLRSNGNVGIGTTAPTQLFSVAEKFQVNSSGLIPKYNNIATTGWGITAIYGSDRKTGLTGAQALATFTVGSADGSFEVSANVNVTAFAVGTFNIQVAYTDETNTAQTLKLNFSTLTGTIGLAIAATGPFEGIPVHIRAKAGTTIIVSSTGTFTSLTYNFEESLRQIA